MKRLLPDAHVIVLVSMLLFGLLLRLWRLDFGLELPYLAHADEPTQYNPAVNIVKTRDLNPHFFNYPSLTIYLDAMVMYAGYWVGKIFGVFQSMADLQPIRRLEVGVGIVGTPVMLLLGRATTAVVGSLTIGLMYVLTKRLTESRYAALLTALLLTVSTAHVRFSHYMTVDVIATFFALACLAALTTSLVRKDERFLWLAALVGGLATSSKYSYGLLALPVGLVCLLEASVRPREGTRRILTSGVLFCLAFALTSPYVLLDLGNAYEAGILQELRHYSTGHLGQTGSSFVWYLEYLWRSNPFYLVLGIPGLAFALWRGRAAIPMVVFIALYFALIGRQVVHNDRTVLPVMVILMVGVGVAIDVVAARIPSKIRDWRRVPGDFNLSPATGAIALVPLLPSLLALSAILQPPSPSGRAMAQAWFDKALSTPAVYRYLGREHLPTLKIAAEAYTVYLDPKLLDVTYYRTIATEKGGLPAFEKGGYDVVVLGSGMFGRFYANPDVYAREVHIYDEFFERAPGYLAFEGRYDPIEFREGGGQVYVFLLSREGKEFMREMEKLGPPPLSREKSESRSHSYLASPPSSSTRPRLSAPSGSSSEGGERGAAGIWAEVGGSSRIVAMAHYAPGPQ
jgi:hypothetical protein